MALRVLRPVLVAFTVFAALFVMLGWANAAGNPRPGAGADGASQLPPPGRLEQNPGAIEAVPSGWTVEVGVAAGQPISGHMLALDRGGGPNIAFIANDHILRIATLSGTG